MVAKIFILLLAVTMIVHSVTSTAGRIDGSELDGMYQNSESVEAMAAIVFDYTLLRDRSQMRYRYNLG